MPLDFVEGVPEFHLAITILIIVELQPRLGISHSDAIPIHPDVGVGSYDECPILDIYHLIFGLFWWSVCVVVRDVVGFLVLNVLLCLCLFLGL